MANASSDTSSVQEQPASQAAATTSANSEKGSPAAVAENVAEPKDAENKVTESSKQKRQVRYSFQKKPFIIGVAGGTASGKSTVCSKIMEKLGPIDPTSVYLSHEKRVICVSQDSFYRKLDDKEKEKVASGNFNFDHPNSFDDKLLESTLSEMKSGKMVKIPVYNYMENQIGDSEQVIYPADVVLVEGLLLFYFPEVRQLFDMKVFVDTDPDTRLARRVMRDVTERHRELDVVLNQYTNFVKPSFEEFCLPTKKYADIIVPRGPDNEVAVDLIVNHIKSIFDPSLRHQSIKYYDEPNELGAKVESEKPVKKVSKPAKKATVSDKRPVANGTVANGYCVSPIVNGGYKNGDHAIVQRSEPMKIQNGAAPSLLRNGSFSSSAPSDLSPLNGSVNGLENGHVNGYSNGTIHSEDELDDYEPVFVDAGASLKSSQSPHKKSLAPELPSPGKTKSSGKQSASSNVQPKQQQPPTVPILMVASR